MKRGRTALLACSGLLLAVVLVAGCDSSSGAEDGGPGRDAYDGAADAGPGEDGADAGPDAGTDAGADPGLDGGADAGEDAGADPGLDAGHDAGGDPGPDGGTDAGADLGSDPGPDAGGDAGSDAGADQGADEGPIVGLPYPERDVYHIKAIQPDYWPDKQELVDHVIGGVSMNMIWAHWEPALDPPPCGGSQVEYDGHCFQIDANVDAAIREYTGLGVIVTGIVYGVPAWARTGNTGCSPQNPGFEIFCTPDNPADYARFAGMIAERYDGLHGHGRIADFVIHNEVNSNIWFDIGCGQGVPCNQDAWIQAYVDNYAAAYDRIKAHQSEAKVLLSFEHHFDTEFDQPEAENAMLSVKTFVTTFAGEIGEREWMLAYHPYAPNLFSPEFGPFDLPRVTYGNLGVLPAWLRATFPDDPHAWEVQLTESGINSAPPHSSEAAQAEAVCDTFVNVLGTPGVTNYIYHRLRDHPDEGGLQLGLIRADDTYKPAWSVWALCNHIFDEPPRLSCGFEDLPYIRLRRSYKDYVVTGRHWTSTRIAPDEYEEESSWLLLRDPQPGTHLLYECMVEDNLVGHHNFLTAEVGCEGYQNLGPVGYIYEDQVQGTVPLYRCVSNTGYDHFVSADPACEGQVTEQLLGYVLPP